MLGFLRVAKYGIDTRIAYKMPIYKQKIYKHKQLSRLENLIAQMLEYITSKILNLPIFPSLSKSNINYIVKSLIKEI